MLINQYVFIEVLLAAFTPSMGNMGFRSVFLNDLQRRSIWEVGRFPAYLTEDRCKELIMQSRNMLHYVSMQGGVWLVTHAGVKSLLCDFKNIKSKSIALNMDEINKLQQNPNPSYNTRVPKGKHHPNRKDYDQSSQADPSC